MPRRYLADKIRAAAKLLPKCNTLDFPRDPPTETCVSGMNRLRTFTDIVVFLVRGFTYSYYGLPNLILPAQGVNPILVIKALPDQ
jgi:hypothetical protein